MAFSVPIPNSLIRVARAFAASGTVDAPPRIQTTPILMRRPQEIGSPDGAAHGQTEPTSEQTRDVVAFVVALRSTPAVPGQ
jgi:hypothetical protein